MFMEKLTETFKNKQIHRQSVESVSFQHGTMEETGHETM